LEELLGQHWRFAPGALVVGSLAAVFLLPQPHLPEVGYGCQKARQKLMSAPAGTRLVRIRVLLARVLVETVDQVKRSEEFWIK
jgi:hypothetical protein